MNTWIIWTTFNITN